MCCPLWCLFFFFNDTATTEIYTLSLHDALPISAWVLRNSDAVETSRAACVLCSPHAGCRTVATDRSMEDRKSTRLNSSHGYISYAVFCLKKKKSCTTDMVSAGKLKPPSNTLIAS